MARSRSLSAWVMLTATLGIIGCSLAMAVLYTGILTLDVPTNHLDGAFQTASGLYRLSDGQVPGRDFYPYLGIGPLFVLYPLFRALGGDLCASGAAAQFITFLAGIFSVATVWHCLWRPRGFATSLVAGCFLFMGMISIPFFFAQPLPYVLGAVAVPGNSLRPVRAVLPFLVAMAYSVLIRRACSGKEAAAGAGVITGLALLWSNDYAFPTAGLFAVMVAVVAWRRNQAWMRTLLIYAISAVVVWVMLIMAATLGHPLDMLRYNFLDVARDQWWYFGFYGETWRVFDWGDAGRLFKTNTLYSLCVVAVLAVLALRQRRLEYGLLAWIGCGLFVGGAVASVGGHIELYFIAFHFFALVVVCVGGLRLGGLVVGGLARPMSPWRDHLRLGTAVALLALGLFQASFAWSSFRHSRAAAANDPERFYVPEFGGYLGQTWEPYIVYGRALGDQAVYEEYWGLLSALRRTFAPWPVDSVIHALGDVRSVASARLDEADVIVTTNPSFSREWQPWSLSQNYWLYQPLQQAWQPVFASPSTIVWRRSATPRAFPTVMCAVQNDKPGFMIDASKSGYYEVHLRYALKGEGRFLVMARNNISFGLDAGGYVSLDPKATDATFPVSIAEPGAVTLDVQVRGKAAHALTIADCDARRVLETSGGGASATGTDLNGWK